MRQLTPIEVSDLIFGDMAGYWFAHLGNAIETNQPNRIELCKAKLLEFGYRVIKTNNESNTEGK